MAKQVFCLVHVDHEGCCWENSLLGKDLINSQSEHVADPCCSCSLPLGTLHTPPRAELLMFYLLSQKYNLSPLFSEWRFPLPHTQKNKSRIPTVGQVSVSCLFHIFFCVPLCSIWVSFSPANVLFLAQGTPSMTSISTDHMDVLQRVHSFHVNSLWEHLGMTTHLSGVLLI